MIFPILEIFNICKFLRRSMMQHSICSCMFFITHVVCWMTKCPCNVLIIIYFLILYCSKFFHEMSSSYITIAPTLSNCPISYFAEYHPCRGGGGKWQTGFITYVLCYIFLGNIIAFGPSF